MWFALTLAVLAVGAERILDSDDGGIVHFNATLERTADGVGLRFYQRHEDYDMPVSGDALQSSTSTFPVVSQVTPGSPAAEAGVRPGDVLLAVDGTSVMRRSLKEIAQLTRVRDSFQGLFWRRAKLLPMLESPTVRGHVITLVAYNRPSYLQRVLDCLARCRGIEKYTVFMFLEPVNPEVEAVARKFTAAQRTVIYVNPVTFGFPHNLRQAVEVGFTHADFCILVEDDILLAEDALEYFEWAREAYAKDGDIFTVSLYGDVGHGAEAGLLQESEAYDVARRRHFTPW